MEVSMIEQEQLLKCKMAQPDSLIIYVKGNKDHFKHGPEIQVRSS